MTPVSLTEYPKELLKKVRLYAQLYEHIKEEIKDKTYPCYEKKIGDEE